VLVLTGAVLTLCTLAERSIALELRAVYAKLSDTNILALIYDSGNGSERNSGRGRSGNSGRSAKIADVRGNSAGRSPDARPILGKTVTDTASPPTVYGPRAEIC
jgi:hypothetical protein